MNKFIYYSLLAGSLFCTACNNDDNASNDAVIFNSAVVKEAPDFVDPRDNTTYKCVQIGNQIWLAENLRYQVPGHSLSGCYTWGEEQGTSEYKELPESYKQAIAPYASVSDNDYMELVYSLAEDPQYDWSEYSFSGFSFVETLKLAYYFDSYISYGQDYCNSLLSMLFPKFYTVFDTQLMALMESSLNSPEVFAIIGQLHFDEAEEENGGYSQEYGMLYSYEGALAAVPEGWRVPTDEDWNKLEQTLGMSAEELDKIEDWRGAGMATLLGEGGASKFNAKRAGGNIYIHANTYDYTNKGKNWYFWSSTQYQQNDSTSVAMIRMSAHYTDKVWRGTSRLSNGYQDMLYSVRLVKDAN